MHYAAKNGDLETMEILATNGADVQQKDKNNETPLHLAAFRGNLEAIKFLLRKGAKEDENLDRQKPSDVALKYGHLDCAKILIRHSREQN